VQFLRYGTLWVGAEARRDGSGSTRGPGKGGGGAGGDCGRRFFSSECGGGRSRPKSWQRRFSRCSMAAVLSRSPPNHLTGAGRFEGDENYICDAVRGAG